MVYSLRRGAMKEKLRRQAVLLRLVNERSVASQEEMVQLLGELGYHTAQSSVSRDVRELGLVRVRGKYVPSEQIDSDHPDVAGNDLKNELITFSEPVGAHLVVVHTPPGAANAVAVDLDQRKLPDVAGTVADPVSGFGYEPGAGEAPDVVFAGNVLLPVRVYLDGYEVAVHIGDHRGVTEGLFFHHQAVLAPIRIENQKHFFVFRFAPFPAFRVGEPLDASICSLGCRTGYACGQPDNHQR